MYSTMLKYIAYIQDPKIALNVVPLRAKRCGFITQYRLIKALVFSVLFLSVYFIIFDKLLPALEYCKISQVIVTGAGYISEAEVKNQSNIRLNTYIWQLQLYGIKQILESNPCIERASIRVVLPNIVFINIVERVSIALWYNKGKFHLIDKNGAIMKSNIQDVRNTIYKDYMFIFGDGANLEIGNILDSLNDVMSREQLMSLWFVGHRRWNIIMADGTTIKLPEKNAREAMVLLNKIRVHDPNIFKGKGMIDLRLAPNKVYIADSVN